MEVVSLERAGNNSVLVLVVLLSSNQTVEHSIADPN